MEQIPKSELWYALKELYRWRKGQPCGVGHLFEKLNCNVDVGYVETQYPILKTAYDLWRRHGNEDAFFTLNHFAPLDETSDVA